MNVDFIAIVQKLIAERGKDIMNNASRFKSLLVDYTGMEYKKERRLLMQAVEAGAVKVIISTQELEFCKKQQIKLLHEDYFITQEMAAEVVDMLAFVLRGDTSKTQSPVPPSIPQFVPQSVPISPQSLQAPAGFVYVQGGPFMMGSPPSEPNRKADETQHRVTVSSFCMGKYTVTQWEYQEVMGSNPSKFREYNLPVEMVSWYDAIAYCNRRSQREGLVPAYTVSKDNVIWNRSANGYRLPTEAEWEYACRAGTTTPYSSGSSVDTAGWCWDNSGARTHLVGEKQGNLWGLYDMHGNVWEWCWDWYGSYSTGDWTDPVGAALGVDRVSRGGSWGSNGQNLRSAYRGLNNPVSRNIYLSFRLLRP